MAMKLEKGKFKYLKYSIKAQGLKSPKYNYGIITDNVEYVFGGRQMGSKLKFEIDSKDLPIGTWKTELECKAKNFCDIVERGEITITEAKPIRKKKPRPIKSCIALNKDDRKDTILKDETTAGDVAQTSARIGQTVWTRISPSANFTDEKFEKLMTFFLDFNTDAFNDSQLKRLDRIFRHIQPENELEGIDEAVLTRSRPSDPIKKKRALAWYRKNKHRIARLRNTIAGKAKERKRKMRAKGTRTTLQSRPKTTYNTKSHTN